MHDNKSERLFRLLSIIIPVSLSIAGVVATALEPTLRIPIISIATSLVFGFTLNTLIRVSENSRVEANAIKEINVHLASIAENSLVAFENEAIVSSINEKNRLVPTQSYMESLRLISNIGKQQPHINSFCEWKRQQLENTANSTAEAARNGIVIIDDPTYELTSSLELLKEVPQSKVMAVSFEDTAFWSSAEGSNFLEEHRRAIDRGVEITRIFIKEKGDETALSDVIGQQSEIGVNVYTVEKDDVAALDPSDIVIYDDILVRRGKNTEYTASNMYKSAELIFSPDAIAREQRRVSGLLQRAIKFDGVNHEA